MIAGQRPDAVGAQELVLIEHPRKNAAQPLGIDQRENAAVAIPRVFRARGMDALQQLGHAPQAFA